MKILAAVAIAVVLLATGARAQTLLNGTAFSAINPPPINWADPIIRISTTFRIAVATKDTESMNDVKAQETGRRTLYRMVGDECAILFEMFKADCRLNSFTIAGLNVPTSAPTSMMAASAVYELKLGGQPSSR